MVTNDKLLLNRSEFSMSSCEIWPVSFPEVGLAWGGRNCVVEPLLRTSPISARMPPPFLIETRTVASDWRATKRLASADRLPRVVSCVRTWLRRPSMNTEVSPNLAESLAITTDSTASTTDCTRCPFVPAANGSAAPQSAVTRVFVVATGPLSARSRSLIWFSALPSEATRTPLASKSTTRRPT